MGEASKFVKARLIPALLLITLASALTAVGPVALKLVVDRLTDPAKGSLSVPVAALIGLYVASQFVARGLQGYQGVLNTLVFSILPVVAELPTIVVVLSRLYQPVFLLLFCGAIVCYGTLFASPASSLPRSI